MAIVFDDPSPTVLRFGLCRFTEDILIDFLRRLPTKTLLRFKCVSKAWRLLLSGPSFHTKAGLPGPMNGFIIRTGPIKYRYYSPAAGRFYRVSLPSITPPSIIAGCCNGLILYLTHCFPELYNVFNFVTGQRVVLPMPNSSSPFDAIGLAFDPRRSPHFRVLIFSKLDQPYPRVFEVYCSERRRWTRLAVPHEVAYCPTPVAQRTERSPVFAAGALYIELPMNKLLKFDAEEETLSVINMPIGVSGDLHSYIGVCQGQLLCAKRNCLDQSLTIWRYNKILNTWEYIKKVLLHWKWVEISTGSKGETHTLENVRLEAQDPSEVRVLAFHPDDGDYLYVQNGMKILAWDLTRMTMEEICNLSYEKLQSEIFPVSFCALHHFRHGRWW